MNPYERSLAINKGIGTTSNTELKIRQLQADYRKSFLSSIDCIPTAQRNGIVQPIIAHRSHLSDSYTLSAQIDETFYAGDLFEFYGLNWIVSDVNANREIYTSGKAIRCNHLFEFQNVGNSKIVKRWGAIVSRIHSDQDGSDALTYLAQTCQIVLPYDDDTTLIHIDKRLPGGIMYDSGGKPVLKVYRVTSIDASSLLDHGDHLLVLNVRGDAYDPTTDNLDLQLCDYIVPPKTSSGARCSILYDDGPFVRAGGTQKTFRCQFLNSSGNIEAVASVQWSISGNENAGISIQESSSTLCKVVVAKDVPVGTLFTLRVSETNGSRSGALIINVAGIY